MSVLPACGRLKCLPENVLSISTGHRYLRHHAPLVMTRRHDGNGHHVQSALLLRGLPARTTPQHTVMRRSCTRRSAAVDWDNFAIHKRREATLVRTIEVDG